MLLPHPVGTFGFRHTRGSGLVGERVSHQEEE